jgi:hypothetical protein
MSSPPATTNRREFCRSLVRVAVLAGLGVLGAVLVRRRAAAGADVCAGDGVCSRCPELDGCGLPPARSAKSVARERT